jgi:DNA polymerase I-like protein with 3'-5' exonuclease and polymerase domains
VNTLILDVETTISNKGNPFDLTNKLVYVGLKTNKDIYTIYDLHDKHILNNIQYLIKQSNLIIGFNIKFDLHWLRKIGIDISKLQIWDCQLAEFILSNQTHKYPSLDDSAIKYGFAPKLDIVKLNYWDKKIDTDAIPKEVLSEYLTQDLLLTQQVYEKQKEQFENEAKGRYKLFRLQCQDLLVLEDIEYNGIVFNTKKALTKAKEVDEELESIINEIRVQIGGVPINLASNDDVSCLLYGGIIKDDIRIPVGTFQTGAKIGQTKYKVLTKEYTLPRLCEPIKGTEVKKGGFWEVNETVLKRLKPSKEAKKIIQLLDRHAELAKLSGTYLKGYSKLITNMNWEPNILHPTLNQCVAVTGRLTSSKPNGQNADPATKLYMETRWP